MILEAEISTLDTFVVKLIVLSGGFLEQPNTLTRIVLQDTFFGAALSPRQAPQKLSCRVNATIQGRFFR